MTKAALIIPYYGKWPEWMELYLYSCHRNPMVDFIFYTDCPLQPHWQQYGNIRFVSLSFNNYCSFVGEKLGIDYSIGNAYKLTDLKPFLGKVHEEDFKGYDFWGFGDLDLVYGDLSNLLSEANLKRYQLITTHSYHVAGHFTLVRNTDYWRNLCYRIPQWQQRVVDEQHYAFDEGEWSHLAFPGLRWLRRLYKYIIKPLHVTDYLNFLEWANPLVNRSQLFSEMHTTPAPGVGQRWIYDVPEGEVTDDAGHKLPYLHFLFFKKTPYYESEHYWREGFYQLEDNISRYDSIMIDANGIQPNTTRA